MKTFKKLFSTLLVIVFILAYAFPVLPAYAGSNETTVDLYYIQDDDRTPIGELPAKYKSTYKINSGLSNPTYRVVEGYSATVDSEGNVTLCMMPVSTARARGLVDTLDVYRYYAESAGTRVYVPYPTVIEATDGTTTKTYTINVHDYAEVYAENKLNTIINTINPGQYSSSYDKLRAIANYVSEETYYSSRYSLLTNIIVHDCGDCISNSQLIKAICLRSGITKAELRRSFQDQKGEGTGHVNLYVEIDGESYIVDVNAGEKGRGYTIKPSSEFCMVDNTIYQYDGFSTNIGIPSSVNGTVVTALGRTDRFDSNKFASIFYGLEKDCPVTKVIIPNTVTTVNPGAFSDAVNLETINVDSGNSVYSSKDGMLYSKDGKKLIYVPAAKRIITLSGITSIDAHAFDDCKDLTIYYNGSESDWDSIDKSALPSGVKVYYGTTRVSGIQKVDPIGNKITFTNRYEAVDIKCAVVPEGAANKEIKIASDNDDVVIVMNGKAYAVGEGSCTITAETVDGGYKTTYTAEVAFTGYQLTLTGGEIVSATYNGQDVMGDSGAKLTSAKFLEDTKVTIKPDDSYDDFNSWSYGEDLEIKDYVEKTGELTFVMPKKDYAISATYNNTKVSTIDSISADGGSLEVKTISGAENYYLTICEDQSVQLTASVSPAWAHNKKMKWTVKPENVNNVTIDENGVATGLSAGSQIKVTVESTDGSNKTKDFYITVKPHNGDGEKTIIQVGDCTETPYIVEYLCPDCGMTIRETIEPDGEHSWDDGVGDATCTQGGEMTYTCYACGMTKTENVEALGHDWDVTSKQDATCTQDGHEEKKVCKRCHIEEGGEVIKALGHDYQPVAEVKATCTTDGYTAGSVCTRCQDVEYGRTKIPATGHNWKDWQVTQEATTTSTGVKTRVCKNDPSHKETQTIPKLADNGSGNTKPKPSSGGESGQEQKPKYSNEWIDGKWYNADGSCTYTGKLEWKSNSTGWWVEDSVGWYPQDSWQKIDGSWYYFKPDGYMAMGEYYGGYWFNGDGSWDDTYFLSWKSNSTGWWVEDKSGWWPSNAWLHIDGSWYYFDGSGYLVTNQYVDGYWLGADGACQ